MMLVQETSLDWRTAQQLCANACEYAEQQGLKVCAQVVDRHGNPLAMLRCNHTALLSTDVARDKAITAVSFGSGTHLWQSRIEDKPLLREGLAQRPNTVLFGGGLALYCEDELVGAIGVSGASEAQDQACASAAVDSVAALQAR
ncbi:MAG: GlcG/HbpS family heme-binding protein [Pseudomonadales bacterium]